ncbi:MAG: SOS response-associated peptidase [Sphingomonadaceae bacterium]|nr:SOS response-associated peptidase [Sphingomonadaceae bacterium]
MCNSYKLHVAAAEIGHLFAAAGIRIVFSEGTPNLEPRDDVRITDVAPIIRSIERGAGDLVQRRWSWPGPTGKPVYNFRADGRSFNAGRCLIPVDGFYEFTTPADPGKKRKDKWLFTMADEPMFCIAGLWRTDPAVGEAFTMLTMPPGPDVAPYHDRQIAVLDRRAWTDWLDPAVAAGEVLKTLPAGSLRVEQVG